MSNVNYRQFEGYLVNVLCANFDPEKRSRKCLITRYMYVQALSDKAAGFDKAWV